MNIEVIGGILIPFVGTTLGAAGVFFMKKELSDLVQRALTGFAAGVMVAASVWSLLIPAMDQSEGMGRLAFIPAVVGFWIGILFLLALDHIIPHLHRNSEKAEAEEQAGEDDDAGVGGNLTQHPGGNGSRCGLCRLSDR